MMIRPSILILLLSLCCLHCTETRRVLVREFSGTYEATTDLPIAPPVYDGKDSTRERIPVSLTPVATGLNRPTDIQFDPAGSGIMLVLEQAGTIKWFDPASLTTGILAHYDVPTVSEQGLLGLAFHPEYPDSLLLYLNLTVETEQNDLTRILEVRLDSPDLRQALVAGHRTILDVVQPYQNHNAGQLAFGPDGYLYIGLGDGGWAGDPHGHGQNPGTMLGTMLRIDVRPSGNSPYTVPGDNPFLNNPSALPEVWAVGLRNPWRYSFDPAGRLIVADVGQNKWEEISIIEPGRNYGWNIREGRHCYDPPEDCRTEALVDPVYEYDHDEGQSITGGYVYTADDIPGLTGKYIFGDFITGRLWALDLAAQPTATMPQPASLGRWQMLVPTFGIDTNGKVYLAEFGHGVIYRIDPP